MLTLRQKKAIVAYYMYKKLKKRKKGRIRNYWIRPLLREREDLDLFRTLFEELRANDEKFYTFFHVRQKTFDKLLKILHNKLKHANTYMRNSITPAERLAVALRYLSSGNTFTALHYSFRIGVNTVALIVREACHYIWSELSTEYLKIPCEEEWLKIAENFEITTGFPHCIGAIGGKHIRVIKPSISEETDSATNYKRYVSIVLVAVVDSDHNFVLVDTGVFAKECDSSVFREITLWKMLTDNKLNLPQPKLLPGKSYQLPFVFAGNETFSLQCNLLRPYMGRHLNKSKATFNNRLTKARQFVDPVFNMLANKWQVVSRPLNVSLDLGIDIIKACCVLHNFVQKEEVINVSSKMTVSSDLNSGLKDVFPSREVQGNVKANQIRSKFAEYLISSEQEHIT